MVGEHAAWTIDAGSLPEKLMAPIDALGPGEHVVIARGGKPIASISKVHSELHKGHPASETLPDYIEQASSTAENVMVVATVMEMSESARVSLSAQLGPGYIVLDVHSAPESADILLLPPLSPKLIRYFQSLCPNARVILAEIEDREHEINYNGPIRRLLDAGVDAYLAPSTLPQLAKQLDHTVTHLQLITGRNRTLPEIDDAPMDQSPNIAGGEEYRTSIE